MYAITGVTGHVGGAAARALRDAGHPVRAVVRDATRGGGFTEAAVADFTDRAALAAALTGATGAFVLLPTIPAGDDTDHRRLAATIAGAVADSGVRHVAALSSYGAELPEGTGPVRWLHHFENLLRDTGARVTAIRSPHFQEKVEEVLAPATGAGIYPVFGASADVPVPMVATRDIGAAVAQALLHPPAGDEVVDLTAPEYTERQVAEALGAVLGRKLEVVTVPREAWIPTWVDAGMPPGLAAELVELYEATERGVLVPRGDRSHHATTRIDETLSGLIS
ncbi:NmrA family NAD(P)-binding protein [Actinoplanes sp. G11-F43]|uniref:NmrA family NAD(P)-binding protein n=1 Tax=Actinoplanes sp. G11-F43 TaxID=3424130 RepID=UPI003D354955